MEERKLLRRLKRGDTSALSELIQAYGAYAYTIASNIMASVMSQEDVEEIVSDAFASLWKNREKIETEALRAYLGAIVRNKAKSALRRYHATDVLEDDILQISLSKEPEKEILLEELRALAHEAVNSLSQPDREIFQRYYFLYQKVDEIGTALGMNSATVRTKLARGRKRLKDYLTERGYSCEDTDF